MSIETRFYIQLTYREKSVGFALGLQGCHRFPQGSLFPRRTENGAVVLPTPVAYRMSIETRFYSNFHAVKRALGSCWVTGVPSFSSALAFSKTDGKWGCSPTYPCGIPHANRNPVFSNFHTVKRALGSRWVTGVPSFSSGLGFFFLRTGGYK